MKVNLFHTNPNCTHINIYIIIIITLVIIIVPLITITATMLINSWLVWLVIIPKKTH